MTDAIDLSLKADMNDLIINHGVHHNKKIMHFDPIQQMVLNKSTYVSLKLKHEYRGDSCKIFYNGCSNYKYGSILIDM